MNKLVKSVPKSEVYSAFIQAMNGVLNLTKRERQLLAEIVRIDVDTPESERDGLNVVSTANRRLLQERTGISPDNMSRCIQKFRNIGVLVRGNVDGETTVNRALIPEIIMDRIQITIILKIDEKAK